MNVFVYGTLMKGQRAHDKLESAKFLGKAVLRDYEVFDLGDFPGIQPHPGGSVVGELYEIDDNMIATLDLYEGEGSLYNREIVYVRTYSDKYSKHCPDIFEQRHKAYAYIYNDRSERHEKVRFEWGKSENDYVWYAAYGSNIDEARFLCYVEGGTCAANGRHYDGCKDTSRWIEEDVALYPGTVYASNNSSSWNGKGVAFYDENETENLLKGFTFMKLYKIRIGQLLDIQKQEGRSPVWYGRIVVVGIHTDGIPVYTITSEKKGEYSEPDVTYVGLIRDAIRKVCEKYDMGNYDFGRDTACILMARNPRFEEMYPSQSADLPHHPYRLLCMHCLNEEINCTCKREDPFRYRYYAEIDEEMFDAVRMFNQKGYYTNFSCQGDARRIGNKLLYESYISFCEYYTEELPVLGIDPQYVKIKRRKKDNGFNQIHIMCEVKIGKTNAAEKEEIIRNVHEAAKKAWIMTAKAWPDKSGVL